MLILFVLVICLLARSVSLRIQKKKIDCNILYCLGNHNEIVKCMGELDIDLVRVGTEGALAGGFRGLARLITYPWDTIKTIAQADESTLRVDSDDSNQIDNKQKIEGLQYFRGLWVTIVSAMPANAVFFIVYYYLERLLPCFIGNNELFLQKLFISFFATIPQNAIKIPAEIVKQRCQVQLKQNSIDIIKSISAEEGIKRKLIYQKSFNIRIY